MHSGAKKFLKEEQIKVVFVCISDETFCSKFWKERKNLKMQTSIACLKSRVQHFLVIAVDKKQHIQRQALISLFRETDVQLNDPVSSTTPYNIVIQFARINIEEVGENGSSKHEKTK